MEVQEDLTPSVEEGEYLVGRVQLSDLPQLEYDRGLTVIFFTTAERLRLTEIKSTERSALGRPTGTRHPEPPRHRSGFLALEKVLTVALLVLAVSECCLASVAPATVDLLEDHAMPKALFFTLLIGAPILIITMSGSFLLGVLGFFVVLIVNPIVRAIRKARYFGSERFKGLRAEVGALVGEHNAVVDYVSEMRSQGSFELGASASGQYAHLAGFVNESRWNNRRDRHVAEFAPHVHHASLQVVRNAKVEPIKYLMKYFSIKADQATLAEVQRVAGDISRLEEAVANVKSREADLTARIAPPKFILKHYSKEFWNQLGAQLAPIRVPYPQYRFEYTSAGGNSSQSAPIQLNTPTLEALSQVLVEKIRWAKSAAGQRALMTSRLRAFVKSRDNHTCRYCRISIVAEPHLLLEVDHIVPVSRGGLSTPENLQTLCWRCNRTKGARIVA